MVQCGILQMMDKLPIPGNDSNKGGTPLQAIKDFLPESLVRQIWLQYFNDYLREHGVITEEEWRKMRRLIERN